MQVYPAPDCSLRRVSIDVVPQAACTAGVRRICRNGEHGVGRLKYRDPMGASSRTMKECGVATEGQLEPQSIWTPGPEEKM